MPAPSCSDRGLRGSRVECAVVDLHPPLSADAGLGNRAARARPVDPAADHHSCDRHQSCPTGFCGTATNYPSVLAAHWLSSPWFGVPWLVALQSLALLAVWMHACIGLHFWLRIKRWYPAWLPILGTVAVLIPALALAGFIAGGNYVWREAEDPEFIANVIRNAKFTPEAIARGLAIGRCRLRGLCRSGRCCRLPAGSCAASFAACTSAAPADLCRRRRTARSCPAQPCSKRCAPTASRTPRSAAAAPAAPPAASGVVDGLATLPEPVGLEASALSRIGATEGVRLACQLRPTADISVLPLLTADASAVHGLMRAGMEGSERQVTVMFIDLRGSTTLGEASCPTTCCSFSTSSSTR